MSITRESSLVDVCFEVCTALSGVETTAVLTGGSAATVYAPHAYQSRDADFIITMMRDRKGSREVLASLGFREFGATYKHHSNPFTLEFPPGPLAIGNDRISSWSTLEKPDRRLHILTRTDCVRDRLASFYFFSDRSALSAAVAVAEGGRIDTAAVRDWSIREGELPKFEEFARASNLG